ncbi:MAG TPA: type II toxin-antitoxin system VapC family toxin [Steroidobacteraceae bacterium]|nr:type II toxin-antitoxin system VapC family toxin [Steroidobacteraceae bacterium]HRX90027.1 type II toxin-antitoxin system VapC family toxin [Steroidobacteraceae bacterium]
MIVLDTNVVSEPLKPRPDPAVLGWLDRQGPVTLYLTTISLAELLAGVQALPAGKRRAELQGVLSSELVSLFAGRILAFGERSAAAYAEVVSSANAAGNPIHFADAAIAAIAMEHNFMLATRNARDFKGTSIELLDPWA